MCEKLLANPLIEDYEILDARLTVDVRFGVIRFPGSCDEVDAVLACERVPGASAQLLWHGDARPGRRRRRRRPRRLLLRRLPARRRDRALLAGHGVGHPLRRRRRARARDLQRLPGALRGGPAAGRAAAERRAALHLPPGEPRGRAGARCRSPPTARRRAAVDPRQAHDRPLLRASRGPRAPRARAGRSSSATRPTATPTARRTTSPACATRPATSSGSCPIPSTPSTR